VSTFGLKEGLTTSDQGTYFVANNNRYQPILELRSRSTVIGTQRPKYFFKGK